MNTPKKFTLQNGLPATLYLLQDARVKTVSNACSKFDANLAILRPEAAYAVRVKVGKHVIHVVYTAEEPLSLVKRLQKYLQITLQCSSLVVYKGQAYRIVRMWRDAQNDLKWEFNPMAVKLLRSILYNQPPPLTALISECRNQTVV